VNKRICLNRITANYSTGPPASKIKPIEYGNNARLSKRQKLTLKQRRTAASPMPRIPGLVTPARYKLTKLISSPSVLKRQRAMKRELLNEKHSKDNQWLPVKSKPKLFPLDKMTKSDLKKLKSRRSGLRVDTRSPQVSFLKSKQKQIPGLENNLDISHSKDEVISLLSFLFDLYF